MYKLVFYVPARDLEKVKAAVFSAGAGKIGEYQECCWQIAGIGQFRPSAEANPFIGQAGLLEQVEEYRVEMVCDDAFIYGALQALKATHPYEEPAYDVWQLAQL